MSVQELINDFRGRPESIVRKWFDYNLQHETALCLIDDCGTLLQNSNISAWKNHINRKHPEQAKLLLQEKLRRDRLNAEILKSFKFDQKNDKIVCNINGCSEQILGTKISKLKKHMINKHMRKSIKLWEQTHAEETLPEEQTTISVITQESAAMKADKPRFYVCLKYDSKAETVFIQKL